MLKIEITGDQELVARLAALEPQMRHAVVQKVNELALRLEAKVKGKLSDDVLHVRTGELRASIHHDVTDTGGSIMGRVFSSAASPAHKYAAIHEFGGVIHHPGGTPYFLDKAGMAVFVKKSSPAAKNLPVTKPHLIRMPERSYLRSSLAEMKVEIVRELTLAAINSGIPK